MHFGAVSHSHPDGVPVSSCLRHVIMSCHVVASPALPATHVPLLCLTVPRCLAPEPSESAKVTLLGGPPSRSSITHCLWSPRSFDMQLFFEWAPLRRDGAASLPGRTGTASIRRCVLGQIPAAPGRSPRAHIMFRASEDEWPLSDRAAPELWVRVGLVFCTLCMVLIQSARLPERNLHSFNLSAPGGAAPNEKPAGRPGERGLAASTWPLQRAQLLIRARPVRRRRRRHGATQKTAWPPAFLPWQ